MCLNTTRTHFRIYCMSVNDVLSLPTVLLSVGLEVHNTNHTILQQLHPEEECEEKLVQQAVQSYRNAKQRRLSLTCPASAGSPLWPVPWSVLIPSPYVTVTCAVECSHSESICHCDLCRGVFSFRVHMSLWPVPWSVLIPSPYVTVTCAVECSHSESICHCDLCRGVFSFRVHMSLWPVPWSVLIPSPYVTVTCAVECSHSESICHCDLCRGVFSFRVHMSLFSAYYIIHE